MPDPLNWKVFVECRDCAAFFEITNPVAADEPLDNGVRGILLAVPDRCGECGNVDRRAERSSRYGYVHDGEQGVEYGVEGPSAHPSVRPERDPDRRHVPPSPEPPEPPMHVTMHVTVKPAPPASSTASSHVDDPPPESSR